MGPETYRGGGWYLWVHKIYTEKNYLAREARRKFGAFFFKFMGGVPPLGPINFVLWGGSPPFMGPGIYGGGAPPGPITMGPGAGMGGYSGAPPRTRVSLGEDT